METSNESCVQPRLVRMSADRKQLFIVFKNNSELEEWLDANKLQEGSSLNANLQISSYVEFENCLVLPLESDLDNEEKL